MNNKLRKTIIAGNWKMNMLASEVKSYAEQLISLKKQFDHSCDMVICAPFTALVCAAEAFADSDVKVGAQNFNQHESGAYTGEVSAKQLLDVGVSFVIIGHSERREIYHETDTDVNEKTVAALSNGLKPIVCVGESLTQREQGVTMKHINSQLDSALRDVSSEAVRGLIIAYEPIWAIGTGKTASPKEAADVCREIRSKLALMYTRDIADSVSILYGGSMNEKNALDLLSQDDIDGGLIGGASLKPETFVQIIKATAQ